MRGGAVGRLLDAKPSACRLTRQSRRIAGSSSTTRMRVPRPSGDLTALGRVAGASLAGSSTTNVEPLPCSDSTQMRPPMAVTKPRTR